MKAQTWEVRSDVDFRKQGRGTESGKGDSGHETTRELDSEGRGCLEGTEFLTTRDARPRELNGAVLCPWTILENSGNVQEGGPRTRSHSTWSTQLGCRGFIRSKMDSHYGRQRKCSKKRIYVLKVRCRSQKAFSRFQLSWPLHPSAPRSRVSKCSRFLFAFKEGNKGSSLVVH